MRRRHLLALLGGTAALRPLAARTQQKAMPVIGFLGSTLSGPYAPFLTAFRQGLSDTGYVDGKNVAIEYRWAEGKYQRLSALAEELVGRKVDLIAASGGNVSALAAKNATSTDLGILAFALRRFCSPFELGAVGPDAVEDDSNLSRHRYFCLLGMMP